MGGNGVTLIRIQKPLVDDSHIDSSYRILGHKVIIQKDNINQVKIPTVSKSKNPLYLCARVEKATGHIDISSIAIYKDYTIVESIDIVTDRDGNHIPFRDGGKHSSHMHKWGKDASGSIGRKPHAKGNFHPIEAKYDLLIAKIIEFNKAQHRWIQHNT